MDIKVFNQQYQISLRYVISILKSFVNYNKLFKTLSISNFTVISTTQIFNYNDKEATGSAIIIIDPTGSVIIIERPYEVSQSLRGPRKCHTH